MWVAGPAAGGRAGRLGRRRHQGRGAERRPDAAHAAGDRRRAARAWPARRSTSTTGASARSCSTCAPTTAARPWSGSSPPPTSSSPTCARRPSTTSAWAPTRCGPATPASSTPASRATAARAPTPTGPATTSAPSGLARAWPRWPCPPTSPSPTSGAGWAITSPPSPRWPASLAALYERERTGVGRLVEVSLLRTGTYCFGWDLNMQLRWGTMGDTSPRTEAGNPMINPYRAADGRWFWLLGVESDRLWPKVLAALDRLEWAEDDRFRTARDRRHHAAELITELDAIFAGRDPRRVDRGVRRARRVVGAGEHARRGAGRPSGAGRGRLRRRARRGLGGRPPGRGQPHRLRRPAGRTAPGARPWASTPRRSSASSNAGCEGYGRRCGGAAAVRRRCGGGRGRRRARRARLRGGGALHRRRQGGRTQGRAGPAPRGDAAGPQRLRGLRHPAHLRAVRQDPRLRRAGDPPAAARRARRGAAALPAERSGRHRHRAGRVAPGPAP